MRMKRKGRRRLVREGKARMGMIEGGSFVRVTLIPHPFSSSFVGIILKCRT